MELRIGTFRCIPLVGYESKKNFINFNLDTSLRPKKSSLLQFMRTLLWPLVEDSRKLLGTEAINS
jgi:hypothetical protein